MESKGTPGPERRRFPRVPLLTDAWVLLEGKGDRLHVKTSDLSSRGLQIVASGVSWKRGEPLAVALRMPTSSHELVVQAEVAWRDGEKVGLSFINVASQTAALIDKTVLSILGEIDSFEDAKTPSIEGSKS